MPRPGGTFWNSVIRPSVCPMAQLPRLNLQLNLQLNHRRPQEMCGLRTRPRTDVDPPRFLIGGETICHRRTAIGGGISSCRPRGDILSTFYFLGNITKNEKLYPLYIYIYIYTQVYRPSDSRAEMYAGHIPVLLPGESL